MIFNLAEISAKFNLNIKGAIHIGAFVGEELKDYRSLGLHNTILFEPQEHLFQIVQNKCEQEERVFNVALGSERGDKEMYISHTEGGVQNGCGASSSLLRPKKHLSEHPHVKFVKKTAVEIDTLDSFVNNNNIDPTKYNFLNIDVQGFELEVLKGATGTLNHIDAMILEINRDEVYEGCPMVTDLDEYLHPQFKRVVTLWQSKSWGDGLYIRI
tara:strand:+ start:20273 stop:20911 length:639 start_codon:yes stop_codon:yes gene_type:complete